jgi:Flp pilus assembly pilin Flp
MSPFGFLNRDDDAQGMVEYALILVLIALAVIAMLGLFGDGIDSMYQRIVEAVSE